MEDRLMITIETYNKSAKNYQNKFMKMGLYNDTYEQFCKLIEQENPQIFEIGVGPGNITQYIQSIRPDFNIYGIDLAPNMIELARRNNPQVEFDIIDCRNIDKIDRKFDAILCGFCTPYLSKDECAKLINDSSQLLNSKGLFYLSTMEDDYSKSGFETTSFSGDDSVYIYYHQADFLLKCLAQSGLELINLQRKYYPEIDGKFLTDMIFIAQKIA